MAAQVDVKRALPFIRSRYLAPAVALFVIAFGLFGVRYLGIGSPALKASPVRAVYDDFFSTTSPRSPSHLQQNMNFDLKMGDTNQDMFLFQAYIRLEDLLDRRMPPTRPTPQGDNSKAASKEGYAKGRPGFLRSTSKQDDSGKGKESPDQNGKEGNDNKGGIPTTPSRTVSRPAGKRTRVRQDILRMRSRTRAATKQAAEGSKGRFCLSKEAPDKQDQGPEG